MKSNLFIKDPIHKEILIRHPIIEKLINTKEFRRLSRITQLGIAPKWFPSATHTRYSHCLGVYEVVSKFVDTLKPGNSNDKTLVQVAALLHDIGHGPFSHVFEKITTMKNMTHEDWTTEIIKNPNTEVYKVLEEYGINHDDVAMLIDGKSSDEKKWMGQLVSSDIDADRIDYLLRDSYYIGTYYGTIDLDILLKRVKILNNKLCFSENCSNLIRSFWYGRIHMNSDVYENKNLLVFEWILELIFERLREIKDVFIKNKDKIQHYDLYSWLVLCKEIDINQYLLMDDFSLTLFLDSICELNIDELLTYLLNSFKTGENFDYINEEEFKEKPEYKIDKKYVFKVKEINNKDIYSSDENKNIWQFFEKNEKTYLVRFRKSNLCKSIKKFKDETKIVFINKKYC